jgi:hypothetical protein
MTILINVLALVAAIITIATKVIEFKLSRQKTSPKTKQPTATEQSTISIPIQRHRRPLIDILLALFWSMFSTVILIHFLSAGNAPATRRDLGFLGLAIIMDVFTFLDLKCP